MFEVKYIRKRWFVCQQPFLFTDMVIFRFSSNPHFYRDTIVFIFMLF